MDNIDQVLIKLSQISQQLDKQSALSKPILSFNEAHQYLNLSKSYLYKLTSSKSIAHFCPLGKKIYFKRVDLDAWLLRNRQSTIEEVEEAASQFTIGNKNI